MSKKDTKDISNIYQEMLNEAKIGSSMNNPVQSGILPLQSGPASSVVLKVKKKKKKRVFENFIGGFLKGMELAKKGKWPLEGPSKKESTPKPSKTSFRGTKTIGFNHPPQKNQIILNQKNPQIKAVVLSNIDKNGQYRIKLIGQTSKETSPYKFYVTPKYPQGIIELSSKMDPSLTGSEELTVGFDTAYPNWIDYKESLKTF